MPRKLVLMRRAGPLQLVERLGAKGLSAMGVEHFSGDREQVLVVSHFDHRAAVLVGGESGDTADLHAGPVRDGRADRQGAERGGRIMCAALGRSGAVGLDRDGGQPAVSRRDPGMSQDRGGKHWREDGASSRHRPPAGGWIMVPIWAADRLMVTEPSPAPSLSLETWKVSLPILMTAICWPLALVLMLEIAPMVAPVLSFTGSPTESEAAAADPPAVALVSAADPEVDGVELVSGGAVACEPLDCIGAS